MRRVIAAFISLTFILFVCAACKAPEAAALTAEPADVTDITVLDATAEPSAAGESAAPEGGDAAQSQPVDSANASVKVLSSVAYVFEGAEGMTLYGAAEYENDGGCPVTIEGASFEFDVAGAADACDFVPIFAEETVIQPGERGFVTLWLARPELAADAAVTLKSVKLTPKKAETNGIRISVGDIYLADNYPKFTTISGSLTLEGSRACSMNVVHFGFYDEDGAFLGAWYFTKNASFEPGDAKSFVVHMRELPIEGLAERCATTKAAGFGVNN